MLFPSLGAHISGAEFQYPDYSWKEPTGLMANLVADSGCNKGQLSYLVEAICRDFREHDKGEMAKIEARQKRDGRIPRLGKFTDEFYGKLDGYLERLVSCKGHFIIRPLNKLTDRLAQDIASLADLTDDDVLWDMSKRALHSAWKAGCILWVLNNQTWTKSMSEFVEWLVYRDIWSKMRLFADMLGQDADQLSEARRRGPKNMLDSLPDTFNEAQLEALRLEIGKSKEGTSGQLRKWLFRKFITYSAQTGLYTKTEEYLKQ
jgi:hypothetical protein